MRKQIALVTLLFSLFFTSTSHAMESVNSEFVESIGFVGTLDEAIEAAIAGEELVNPKAFVELITKKLIKFSLKNRVYSEPINELALFVSASLNFQAVVRAHQEGTSQGLEIEYMETPSLFWATACQVVYGAAASVERKVMDAFRYLDGESGKWITPVHRLRTRMEPLAEETARSAYEKAIAKGRSEAEAQRIGNQVAGWILLNNLYANLDSIVCPMFKAGVEILPKAELAEHAFLISPIAQKEFLASLPRKILAEKKRETLSWLKAFDKTGFVFPQGALIVLAHGDDGSVFYYLPRELVVLILQSLFV